MISLPLCLSLSPSLFLSLCSTHESLSLYVLSLSMCFMNSLVVTREAPMAPWITKEFGFETFAFVCLAHLHPTPTVALNKTLSSWCRFFNYSWSQWHMFFWDLHQPLKVVFGGKDQIGFLNTLPSKPRTSQLWCRCQCLFPDLQWHQECFLHHLCRDLPWVQVLPHYPLFHHI